MKELNLDLVIYVAPMECEELMIPSPSTKPISTSKSVPSVARILSLAWEANDAVEGDLVWREALGLEGYGRFQPPGPSEIAANCAGSLTGAGEEQNSANRIPLTARK